MPRAVTEQIDTSRMISCLGKQSWDGYVQHCTSDFATALSLVAGQAVLTVQQHCDIDYQFCVVMTSHVTRLCRFAQRSVRRVLAVSKQSPNREA